MPEDNWSDMSTFCCDTCRVFVPKDAKIGRCRRHAPVVGQGWPVVYKTDWCGDHKIKAMKGVTPILHAGPLHEQTPAVEIREETGP